jgi:phosphoserine phosphatase
MTMIRRELNVFVDVDHTLVYIDQHQNILRPGAREALLTLRDAGHRVYIWSAGGEDYARRTAHIHGLHEWVHGYFEKSAHTDPRPDLIIDDDGYLVQKYGGYTVPQYKQVDDSDTAFEDALRWMIEQGHL